MASNVEHVETLYQGRSTFKIVTVRRADGVILKREIEEHGQAVCVLPYDPARRTAILVRQFRVPVFLAAKAEDTLEAIAGILESRDPFECARREALEEAGLQLTKLEPVAGAWTMPGVSTEYMHLYLAPYGEADRTGPGGGLPEEHESTQVVELALNGLAAMADAGRLDDMKTLALVQTLRLRRPDLFT
jgi:nudix-type nucleoside diphosphatase (YffH/AdpP family)